MGRRRFLTVTGAAAALAFAVNLPAAGTASAAEADARRIAEDPFTSAPPPAIRTPRPS